MKKLIIMFAFLMLLTSVLPARHLQRSNQYKSTEINEVDRLGLISGSEYGRQYYRSNARHRFKILPEAKLKFFDLEADVDIISWKKDFGEIEIMKISPESAADLDNCKVWLDNSKDIIIGTNKFKQDSTTLVKIILKLPQHVETASLYDHNGELRIKNIDPVRHYSR